MTASQYFIKDPGAIEWFGVNWTDRLAGELPLVAADTIASSTWTVPTGITSVTTLRTNYVTGVKLSGGTLGSTYHIVNNITTTTNAETLQATISIRIENE